MKLYSLGPIRPLFIAALLASASLLTTACQKEEVAATAAPADYGPIDEGLIKKYLADHAITTAQRQASGLYFVPGTSNPGGAPAAAGKTVSVLYTGSFLNGTVFDASAQHGGAPISFVLGRGQVIAGWDEGLALLRKGEKGTLLIPSALGYGPSGYAPVIAPNTVLRFEVELVDVQ